MTSSAQFELFATADRGAPPATHARIQHLSLTDDSRLRTFLVAPTRGRGPYSYPPLPRRGWLACLQLPADHPWVHLPAGHPARPHAWWLHAPVCALLVTTQLDARQHWLAQQFRTRRLAVRALNELARAAAATLAPSRGDVEACLQANNPALVEYAIARLIPRLSADAAPVAAAGARAPHVVKAWVLDPCAAPVPGPEELLQDADGGFHVRRADGPPVPVAVAPWLWVRVTCEPDWDDELATVLKEGGSVVVDPRWPADTSRRERAAPHPMQRYAGIYERIVPAAPADRVRSLG